MSRTITVDHAGVTYSGQVMTIKRTSLGGEDHGITTAYLHCEGDGSGIGVGGYGLDTSLKDEETGKHLGREGTAYGLDHIMKILRTVGVDRWEQLPGKQIVVLYEGKGHIWGKQSVGFAHVVDEDRVLIFKEHADSWKQRDEKAA